MDTIVIRTTTSYQARDAVLGLIEAGFKSNKAEIRYDLSQGLPPLENEDLYPLTLEGSFHGHPTTIKVYGVTAGYGGTGPNDLVTILKKAGFPLFDTVLLTDVWCYNSKISITCFIDGEMQDNIEENVVFCYKS